VSPSARPRRPLGPSGRPAARLGARGEPRGGGQGWPTGARARRSVLFASGGDRDALARGRNAGPDTLILDLEDTVAPSRKPGARALVIESLGEPAPVGTERAVRVNAPITAYFPDDLAAAIRAGADAIVIPKVDSAADVRRVDDCLARAEADAGRPAGSALLLPLIETARGVLDAYAIATASFRVAALLLGHLDLSLSLGLPEASIGEGTLLHARCQVVLAARAAGREAIDALFVGPADADGFRAEAREGRRLGFAGKLLLHPEQVPLVHEVYAPSPTDVARARRVVEAFEEALAGGTGMFVLDGRLIDRPVVDAERAVLERARRAGVL
jgi:citrate lyase subunit beta / citryl-CoA lyase